MSTLENVRVNVAEMTVAALAREARIDRKTIEKAEAGERISSVKAASIANALSRATGQTYTVASLGILTS
jgi:DNA-binding XRE family transcriptional regulator